jgi:hypothetical protein
MDKPELTLKDIDQILSQITLEKDRQIFNKSLVESLYNKF